MIAQINNYLETKIMKRINLLLSFLILIVFSTKAQQNYEDVVFLKNGSVIHGVIIEQIPNKSIKIKTKDGSIFVYAYTEIQKMTKEQVVSNYSVQNNTGVDKTFKNPTTALLFSFLIPGGGQFYNHEYTKGAIMLGVDLIAVGVGIIGATNISYHSGTYHPGYYLGGHYYSGYSDPGYYYSDPNALMYIGFGLQLANGIYSMIDASNSAKAINKKNGLGMILKLDRNTDLALQPDYKIDYYGGNKPSSVFGAKLSLNLY